MDNKSIRINITGDFVINEEYSVDRLDKGIVDLFRNADFNIINLEAPVTASNAKILKTGPHLKADRDSTVAILKALDIYAVTLANNHILDYDEEGVSDTISFCKKNNLRFVGAGANKKEAAKILSWDTPQGTLVIINIAENEWASATNVSAGANGMDLIDNSLQIRRAKEEYDFVFVIVHGGHEYYNLPSPRMQKQYRFYVECGADIVIGHHTHCVSGYELYKGVPIYYSLGNFLFTKKNINKDWYQGLVLEVQIKDKKIKSQLHAVQQSEDEHGLSLITGVGAAKMRKRLEDYNEIISDSGALEKQWNDYVNSRYKNYINLWSPISFISNAYIRAVYRKIGKKLINKRGFSYFLNLMRCESHLDLSKEVLNRFLKK